MDWNRLNKFERGPTKAHYCEVWSKSNQWFRRKCHLKKLFTDAGTDGRTHRHTKDDGQNVITKAHPHCVTGELKIKKVNSSQIG